MHRKRLRRTCIRMLLFGAGRKIARNQLIPIRLLDEVIERAEAVPAAPNDRGQDKGELG